MQVTRMQDEVCVGKNLSYLCRRFWHSFWAMRIGNEPNVHHDPSEKPRQACRGGRAAWPVRQTVDMIAETFCRLPAPHSKGVECPGTLSPAIVLFFLVYFAKGL